MASNRFANMLHRNSNRLTAILVYAVLEWILIILLLLNSFFLYLITKFANYFGLKPPCLWCSRVDHVLEPGKTTSSYTDLLCETHATEISKLGYCSNHKKLAETHQMCMQCFSSRPNHPHDSYSLSRRIAFFSWEDEPKIEAKACSCCDQSLNNCLYPPYLFFKDSWKALKYNTEKGSLIIEALDDDDDGSECRLVSKSHSFAEIERNDGEHQMLCDAVSFGLKDSVEEEECSGSELNLLYYEDHEFFNRVHPFFDRDIGADCLVEFMNLHFEKNRELEVNRLIPVEELDASTCANQESFVLTKDHETFDSSLQIKTHIYVSENEENPSCAQVNIMEKNMDSILNLEGEACDSPEAPQILSTHVKNIEIADTEKITHLQAQEKKIDDSDFSVDQTQSKPFKDLSESTLLASLQELPDSPKTYRVDNDVGTNYRENRIVEEASISAETVNQLSSNHLESNEAEEEKFPETPTSVDSFQYLHKKLLLFEKRESGTDESLDGSVVSETDAGDPVLTVEKLRTALKAEHKALNAIYSELEEERSASAIAANQTMAMINRLQEEKAAMQMEALQYQRMMEEQSEYDQEALQLLNELMIKREREKQELEKELEVYRKKVLDYEAKERMRMMRRSKDGSVRSRTSSATCSNSEDVDELSIDLNREARDEEDGSIYRNKGSSNNDTAGEEVINLEEIALDCVNQISALDDSLAEFEEERLSILDQLKALEEKLLSMHDNELNEDERSLDHSSKYSVKGFDESHELSTPEENDISHHTERKTIGSMAKSLLPLLDATENETEESLIFEDDMESEFVEMEHISVPKFELESKKVALEEEVDHVYERLQALEADREFLKHCVSSVKKGDKGMDLLQEILQHLRDLRAVELRVRSMNDDPLG